MHLYDLSNSVLSVNAKMRMEKVKIRNQGLLGKTPRIRDMSQYDAHMNFGWDLEPCLPNHVSLSNRCSNTAFPFNTTGKYYSRRAIPKIKHCSSRLLMKATPKNSSVQICISIILYVS